MPSAYTASLRLVLPVTGELDGLWGDTANNGLTKLVDDAVAGTAAVAMPNANYTLSTAVEAPDEARCMFITLTGVLSAQRNVVCPSQSKLYFVTNNTTGGQSILFKTAAGTGIVISPGQRYALYCDGTNVLLADSQAGGVGIEVDVASAATTTIGGLTNKVRITGTTTISSLGTVYTGPVQIRLAADLNFTAGAALIIPYGTTLYCRAGDVLVAYPKATSGVADGWILIPQANYLLRMPKGDAGVSGSVAEISGNVTLNTGLPVDSLFTFYNNTDAAVSLIEGAGLTLRLSGTTLSGTRSVGPRSFATVWVRTTSEYVASGVS